MVALVKYHEVSKQFLATIRDADQDLAVVNGALFLYEGGAWRAVTTELQDQLNRIARECADEHDFPYAEKETALWRHIKTSLQPKSYDDLDECGWIALPNGTLDPITGTEHPHDPDHFIMRRAAIEYKPNAKCPQWLKMLDRMLEDKPVTSQNEIKLFLQMWFGMALVGFRDHNARPLRKMLFLFGARGTGKTTVSDVLKEMLGKQNIAADTVDQLSTRFGLESVLKSVAIVADDAVGSDTKMKSIIFKRLITGEESTADRKGKNIVKFRFNGPILITANDMPKVQDMSDALYERTIVIEFTRQFTAADMADDFEGKPNAVAYLTYKKEWPGILNWALQGLAIARELGAYPALSSAKEGSAAWREQNDPVFAFLNEHAEFDADTTNFPLPVAAAISVYAQMQMGTKEFPTSKITAILGRNVTDIVPGVQKGRKQLWKEQARCYLGLRLRDSGLRYVAQAREMGLLPNQFPVNEQGL